jgi:hypothetical protein
MRFKRGMIQRKSFVASTNPPKEVWVDWAMLVDSNMELGVKMALKDCRKRNPEYEFRFVITEE